MSRLAEELDRYLTIRRSLGYDLGTTARVLRRFIAFAESQGAEHVGTDLFLRWQGTFGRAGRQTWAARLGMVRLFAQWLHSLDPAHEVPPQGLIPNRYRRSRPYIYSDVEIVNIVAAAAELPSVYGLRGLTCSTLFGLADVAGGIDSQANRLVVLDPRIWTLLNGDDGKSRVDIRRVFGVGDGSLVVDNAASCVVAVVNTYQRRYAVQAAQEVLTWRLVASQVVEDDERADVVSKLADAESNLKTKVRGAYRHYVYLTRKGEQLDVVFARFDDDKQTSLIGNDVWTALIAANRAVGEYMDPTEKRRKRMGLSAVFVSLLLDNFERHLTLKDVASSFYKDPRFPLVPSLDEIRQVIYDLVQPTGYAGSGTGGWELVGSDGEHLRVESPKQLAISSIQQQLRRARTVKTPDGNVEIVGEDITVTSTGFGEGTRGTGVGGSDGREHVGAGSTSSGGAAKSHSYSWYRSRSRTGQLQTKQSAKPFAPI